jgi:hypothetical protein
MRTQLKKNKKMGFTHLLSLKYGAVFLFILLSVLVIACGNAASTNQPGLDSSLVTATIQLGSNTSYAMATPPAAYSCAAWATQTSPAANMTSVVGINAKFIHNVNGNPEGVEGATAIATVSWGAGQGSSMQTQPVTTTADGLAVFKIDLANNGNLTNITYKEFIVSVSFSKAGVPACNTDSLQRNAFFTLIMASPTSDNNNNNCNNNGGNGKHHHKNNNNCNAAATATAQANGN